MVCSRPLILNFVFSIQLTGKICSKQKFGNDWILTADLWCWKRPLYQLTATTTAQHLTCLFFLFQRITWNPSDTDRELCLLKGKSEVSRKKNLYSSPSKRCIFDKSSLVKTVSIWIFKSVFAFNHS